MITWTIIFLMLQAASSAPVDQNKPVESDFGKDPDTVINDLGLEYGRYLQEVVSVLEEDKDFAKKLENVSAEHIKSGAIASELNFVNHNVRTKLDELKRIEMDRLRRLAKQEHDLQEFGTDHLDHSNPHSFEAQDLHKLIVKATHDLEELDKKRREEFKRYEMEKEYQYRESLKNMTEEQKTEAVKKHDETVQKHKEHPRVHHPGSKQQFEEVWEEQDHMPKEEFNPKTFFALHDVNGDGYLDPEEVEALLSIEVKKMYDPNNPEDDPNEMEEEYHRMREHIYKEADTNKDGLISRKEFIDLTHKADFDRDEGWKGIDEQQMFNEDELRQYEARRQEYLAQQYGYYMPPYQPHMQGPPPPHQQFGHGPQYQVAQHQGYPQHPPPPGHGGYQAPPQFAVHPNAQYQPQSNHQNQQQYYGQQHPPPPPPPQLQHQQYQNYQQQPQMHQQPQIHSSGNPQIAHVANPNNNIPPPSGSANQFGAPPQAPPNQQYNVQPPSGSAQAAPNKPVYSAIPSNQPVHSANQQGSNNAQQQQPQVQNFQQGNNQPAHRS